MLHYTHITHTRLKQNTCTAAIRLVHLLLTNPTLFTLQAKQLCTQASPAKAAAAAAVAATSSSKPLTSLAGQHFERG